MSDHFDTGKLTDMAFPRGVLLNSAILNYAEDIHRKNHTVKT